MDNNAVKTGLVLEGGAMRGLFTAGVLDVLMEHGFQFDGMVGVSAGSSFGCNYKSRQPGRVLRYNLAYARDPRYMGLRSLLRTGNLVNAEFSYHTLPLELDVFDSRTFEENPMEFYMVCTDVATGQPVYQRMDHVDYQSLEWLRASASMPAVTRPVEVEPGRFMLDGGISDSIPLKFFLDKGYNRCVTILTQPRDYFKKSSGKWLWKILLRKHPALAEAMVRRPEMYNSQLRYVAEKEREGLTFVIAPDAPLPIGRIEMNPDKMRHVYHLGRAKALALLPTLRTYLTSPTP